MLLNLLPGLRQLRAPLAAGSMWMAAAWLVFSGDAQRGSDDWDALDAVYRFTDAASPAALVTVALFAAYLIGILSVALSNTLAERWRQTTRGHEELFNVVFDVLIKAGDALRPLIAERADRPPSPIVAVAVEDLTDATVRATSAFGTPDCGRTDAIERRLQELPTPPSVADRAPADEEGTSFILSPEQTRDYGEPIEGALILRRNLAFVIAARRVGVPLDRVVGAPKRWTEEGLAASSERNASLLARTQRRIRRFIEWRPPPRPLPERPRRLPRDVAMEQMVSIIAMEVIELLWKEFDRVRLRLSSSDERLFARVDQADNEAEFRYAVALALLGVIIALAFTTPAWVSVLVLAAGALAIYALWRQAIAATRTANDLLIDALVLGRVRPPVLDPLYEVIAASSAELQSPLPGARAEQPLGQEASQ